MSTLRMAFRLIFLEFDRDPSVATSLFEINLMLGFGSDGESKRVPHSSYASFAGRKDLQIRYD